MKKVNCIICMVTLVLGLFVCSLPAIITHPGAVVADTPPDTLLVRCDAGSGVVIGTNTFVTAKHVTTANRGRTVRVAGVAYTVTAHVDHPKLDLKVCHVAGTFPTYAHTTPVEGTKKEPCVIGGWGRTRGDVVEGGYKWCNERRLLWAESSVNMPYTLGYRLFFREPGAYPNDGALALYDSGGGLFVKRHGTWYLLGVGVSVSALNESKYAGDVTENYYVALSYAYNWVCMNNPTRADINGDGKVDINDFSIVSNNWSK